MTALHTPSWQFGPLESPDCDCRATSDCCGAEIVADDICGQCREHCGLETYCHCEDDEADRREAEAEMRADARVGF